MTIELTIDSVEQLGWSNRSLLREADVDASSLNSLIELAQVLKAAKRDGIEPQLLTRKNIALIFEKTSTRTRCAFEVAAADQGASTTYLDSTSSQLGHKESVSDTARVLSRFFDAIEFRGSEHSMIVELAEAASVPVYNGLTDDWHPTQMLADFQTMKEHSNLKSWSELSYAYLGDARNNMGNSLLMMGAVMGCDVRIGAPPGLLPSSRVVALAQRCAATSGARLTLTSDPHEAVADAAFVHTDVWVSMGEPASSWEERVDVLRPFRVDSEMMAATGRSDARFMHCLPAFHDGGTVAGAQAANLSGLVGGIEVTDEVFESPASIVFDQAENRLHTIKALLVATLAGTSQRDPDRDAGTGPQSASP